MKKLSLVIPCYNEASTLNGIVEEVLKIRSADLALELVIVDDCSTDASRAVAEELAARHPEVKLCFHEKNRGKGAALRTGFLAATGDYVGIQDADMEYDPGDYLRMIRPLEEDRADIVLGSRYLRREDRVVLKWWHSTMNRFLTWLSNVFTDLDLTDMETCYKLFRREIIQKIAPRLEEDRFGFEPEVVSEIARSMRFEGWRVGEVAISYRPRTFSEGKKIGWRDGVRALFCIFHYNAPSLPVPMQLIIYFAIGATAAVVNIAAFWFLRYIAGVGVLLSVEIAFVVAAAVNYVLCIAFLFRHKARWSSVGEIAAYVVTLVVMGALDWGVTEGLMAVSVSAVWAKAWSNVVGFFGNYLMRRFLVFGRFGVSAER
jgi:glycosyltransferase involved in cell wall biosynthesis